MSSEGTKRMGIAGIIAVVIAAFQLILLTRYVSRLPGDTLGIWLNVAALILWVVVAILFFRKSRS